MFEENGIMVFRVTVKKIIERLSELQDVDCAELKSVVEEQFNGYDFEDIEDVVGFDTWPNISNDGKYELNVKVDHEDAYEFTIHIEVKDTKATVINVL